MSLARLELQIFGKMAFRQAKKSEFPPPAIPGDEFKRPMPRFRLFRELLLTFATLPGDEGLE